MNNRYNGFDFIRKYINKNRFIKYLHYNSNYIIIYVLQKRGE